MNSRQPNKLAVILPSRGLMFSETFEELLGELDGFNYQIYWSHGKPLPDCFNDPLDKILADSSVFAVLICEDDMIIPKGILKKMFDKNYPAIALDYPFKNDGDSTMLHAPDGMAIYSGTGFILLAKQILEALPKPVFRTDTAWDCLIKGNTLVFWPRKLKKIAYGLHDVNLGITLFSNQIPIRPMLTEAGQRKLVRLGEPNTNDGAHKIRELRVVGRDLVIKTVSESNVKVFKEGLARVTDVAILDQIPEYIGYHNGQAFVKNAPYQLV